jgi:hypothetical protein
MSLSPGSRLGRYEILQPLGAGGMGEVYRARDTRLDRDVAIKILPESVARDPERLARFDREAKAVAALSHPNILALHDAGTEDGTTFAVMELLDGETLRDRLASGPLPVRRAVDTAVQVARGLAAAHAKGLVHRDLKPENVFLVADGQVKILDFGLAKTADPGDSTATTTHAPAMTDPGTVLGTVGYMAPEQVRGHAVDARTDLFALGSVFYEMLTGQRAFRRDTAAETMTAILREDPPDLPQPQSAQAPALDRIIRHCLEKNPGERFQSARDVAFALEALSGTTGSSGMSGASRASGAELSHPSVRSSKVGLAGAASVLAVAVAAAAWAAGYVHFGAAPAVGTSVENITYQPVTFDEGFVFAARFARDGRTIVYSADWENQKTRDIFVTSLENSGARALGYKGSDLLAVSPDGALAILMDGTVPGGNPYGRRGTIARASLTGGAPRPELDRVTFADFGPDQSLAVIRDVRQKRALETVEWPQGAPLKEPETSADLVYAFPTPRVSPSGANIAFFVCRATGCTVRIAGKTGETIAESKTYFDWWGLAWAPGGREVWFAVAETNGRQCTLRALDLSGRERVILRTPGAITLHDISAEGRVLAAFDQVNARLEVRDSPSAPPRDLSWKEGGDLADFSRKGVVLFGERGDSAGPTGSVYVRRPGDLEPTRISDGVPIAISDDGTQALVRSHVKPIKLTIVPTSGLAQPLDVGPLDDIHAGGWLKDGRLVLELRRPGESGTVYVRPAAGGALARLLPAGVHVIGRRPFSPDGQRVTAADEKGEVLICTTPATGEGACTPVTGSKSSDDIAGWASDNRSLFLYQHYPVPIRVDRLDVATGRRELFATVQPASAAVSGLRNLVITPDGAIAYTYGRSRSTLYVISGLK